MFKGLNGLKVLSFLLVVTCSVADEAVDKWEAITSTAPEKSAERGYVEPFKLFDNVYYVGDKWVSAFLLNTNEGLILIDTMEYPYSKWLPDNIRHVGFEPNDIKAILITHGHSDHVGGAGLMQSLTNAKVMMLEEDVPLLNQQAEKNQFPKPTINHFPKNGETFVLGDSTIKFYETPGHTKGCMSLEFSVYHQTEAFRAFVVCGNGTNFQVIGLARSYVNSVKTATQNPYVDTEGFQVFLSLLRERGREKLEEELARWKDRKKPIGNDASSSTDVETKD
jgi:metallo-beta-lactamase class B